MTTYNITMDDGKRWDQKADSAAAAIQKALAINAGHRVTKCWLGLEEGDSTRWGGRTVFEVPPHEPVVAVKKTKRSDATSLLFDEAESVRLGVIKPGRD